MSPFNATSQRDVQNIEDDISLIVKIIQSLSAVVHLKKELFRCVRNLTKVNGKEN